MENLKDRKKEHLELAFQSRTDPSGRDPRFHYEPMLHAHPISGLPPIRFLGKALRVPMWVSGMTGGIQVAGIINRNLAMACNEFGMGMGLGSCRAILDDDACFQDFNMRDIIGNDLPLWANLGIAQVEELVGKKQVEKAVDLVGKLRADGLVIHVNPMQEWFQPEGDVLHTAPLDTIRSFMEQCSLPLMVKEVGQGMGPESLRELLRLPLQAIEFAAYGGTNFARVELLRNERAGQLYDEPLSRVGATAEEMVDHVNSIVAGEEPLCKEVIISGGITHFLDGYYLIRKSALPAIYGMASELLRHAMDDYERLRDFIQVQVRGLEMAYTYLTLKE